MENKGFLGRNIAYLISGYVLLLWGAITLIVIGAALKVVLDGKTLGDLTVVSTIWGAVSTVASIPINYYLGSSHSSADKQKTIDKMTDSISASN